MPKRDKPFFSERNILGQRKRRRSLKSIEREVLINTVESAMNDPRCTEARIYWNERGVWCAPVSVVRTEKLNSDGVE